MFNITNETTTKIISAAAKDMSHAAIRSAGLTKNFSMSYEDLPDDRKHALIAQAASYNENRGILNTAGCHDISNAIVALAPAAAMYLGKALALAQSGIDTNKELEDDLLQSFKAAEEAINYAGPTAQLKKIKEQNEAKPATTDKPEGEDQAAA